MKDGLKKIGKVILIIAIVKAVLIALGIAGFVIYKHYIEPQGEAGEETEEETE